jgi:hypothetical protein
MLPATIDDSSDPESHRSQMATSLQWRTERRGPAAVDK